MPATFDWKESNGAGETETGSRTETNWKNIDDSTTAYTASAIVAGNRSYDKFQYGKFTTGTFNNLLNGLWEHTAGAATTGVTLKAAPAMTADGDRVAYRTPATTANATLTDDMTAVTAIGSGKAVWFGPTGPAAAGKAATVTGAADAFTNYLATQIETTGATPAGDITTMTITLQYDEN